MAKTNDNSALLASLQRRFEAHRLRHPDLIWAAVQARLECHPAALRTLAEMEATGGEPDVVGTPDDQGRIAFVDCAAESPAGRRSLCYDDDALNARKEAKPAGSAAARAAVIGVELLTEEQYRALQAVGEFDLKTSSWVQTPPELRKLGGALFCDRRYGRVFTYHNGVQSYYAARGWRGLLRV